MTHPFKTLKLGVQGIFNRLGYVIVKLPPKPGETSGTAVVLVGGRKIKIHKKNPLYEAYQKNPELNSLIGIGARMVKERFPDSWAVDVGANIGDTLALIKAKADMPVICIEGDPREGADARLHQAACHFAPTAPGLNGTAHLELTEKEAR